MLIVKGTLGHEMTLYSSFVIGSLGMPNSFITLRSREEATEIDLYPGIWKKEFIRLLTLDSLPTIEANRLDIELSLQGIFVSKTLRIKPIL